MRHIHPHSINIDRSVSCIYNGPGQNYIEDNENNSVTDLSSGEMIKINDVDVVDAYNAEIVEDFADIAQLYISGEILSQPIPLTDEPAYKQLKNVPLYNWEKGCVPTAMAMIVAYHYSGFTEKELIAELAKNMGTAFGSTFYYKVPQGTKKTLSGHNKKYTSINFASTNSENKPNFGPSYNTFDAYQNEILAGRPVFIAMVGAEYPTTCYPDGFHDHSLTGIGYNRRATMSYVIVYTTMKDDEDVTVPVRGNNLGSYAWCYVIP